MRPAVDTPPVFRKERPPGEVCLATFLHDQKDIWWTFPKQLAKGRHWVPTLIVVGGTAGLIYADPHVMPYFHTHQQNWDDFNDVFDPLITTGEVILAAGWTYGGGVYPARRSRGQHRASGCRSLWRQRGRQPGDESRHAQRAALADVPPGAPFTGTFFNGGKSPLKGSSFPSGHSTAVWSVATIVAERYRHRGKPWIPMLVVHAGDCHQRLAYHSSSSLPVGCLARIGARLYDRQVPDVATP